MSKTDMWDNYAHREKEFLEGFPCPLIRTNLKGAFAVPPPADGFDPITASADDLIRNGIFWKRPSASSHRALAKAWHGAFSRKGLAKDWIIPQLEPQARKTHNLRRSPRPQPDETYNLPANDRYAGAGLRGSGPWDLVTGMWEVPLVSRPPEPPPQGSKIPTWDSSSWVGIDGFFDANDALQAGVQQEVIIDDIGDGSTSRPTQREEYVAWYEWFAPRESWSPAYIDQVNIPNMEVSPGQQVMCVVSYLNEPNNFALGTLGSIHFSNLTTNQSYGLILFVPPRANAAGESVEWIMEAPNGGELYSSLPKFSPVVFTSAVASNVTGAVGNPQNGGYVTNITTEFGPLQLLTSVTVGDETVTIDFAG
jgi:hypothetical protein